MHDTPEFVHAINGVLKEDYRGLRTRIERWLYATFFQPIHIKLDRLMITQQQFDEKLNKLKPAIDQVKSDFEAYKAAAAAKGVDLTEEATALDNSLASLDSIHSEISAPADPAPDAPTDQPTTGN